MGTFITIVVCVALIVALHKLSEANNRYVELEREFSHFKRECKEVSGLMGKGSLIIERAHEDAESVISQARLEAETIVSEAEKESARIVTSARMEADSILIEAKGKDKEAEGIVARAREEADSIVNDAKRIAKETAITTIVDNVRQIAAKREAKEASIKQAGRKAAEIISQAKLEADEIVRQAEMEAEEIANKVQQKTGQAVEQAENLFPCWHSTQLAKDGTSNFVSVDFEWQGSNHDACAVGMVKVIGGVVVSKFYSLIKPVVGDWDIYSVATHGINAELCKNAPTFRELEPFMESFVGGLLLVGHNYNLAERLVFEKCARPGSPLVGAPFFDTCKEKKVKLTEYCKQYDIPLEAHHDALEDANACAALYRKLKGREIRKPVQGEVVKGQQIRKKRDSALNFSPDLSKVEHTDNPFYGKGFTVSGFSAETRDKLIVFLRDKMGGTNRNKISGQVKILIIHTSMENKYSSKRLDAIANNIPYYNEYWLHDEIFVKYGYENEWDAIFN